MVSIEVNPKDAQLHETLRWLHEEKQTTGEGFYCNRGVISKAHQAHLFHCLLEHERILAFVVLGIYGYESEISILEVHPAYRRHGFGSLLVNHSCEYLKARGAKTVDVQCTPPESEPFWRAKSFTDHPNLGVQSSGATHLQRSLSN